MYYGSLFSHMATVAAHIPLTKRWYPIQKRHLCCEKRWAQKPYICCKLSRLHSCLIPNQHNWCMIICNCLANYMQSGSILGLTVILHPSIIQKLALFWARLLHSKVITWVSLYVTGPAKIGHVGSQNLTTFQTFGFHNFLFQYGAATKFSEFVYNLFGFAKQLTESKYYISALIYVSSNDMVYFSPHALFSQARSHIIIKNNFSSE